MKVLVTGATGFIGNYVIPELLKRNVEVIATATDINKAKSKGWFKQVTFIEHLIAIPNSENLFTKFKEPDVLIHLAWGDLSNFKSETHLSEVLPSHLHFLKNLLENGLRDLTVIGTCLEYGMQEGELNEEMECKPTIAYPMAKHQLRLELEKLKANLSFSFKWIRLFYMYGEGQTPKSILPLLDKALEANEPEFKMSLGEQIRDYLPVEKVSENIVIFALQQKVDGIVNCSSNEPISIKQLVINHLKRKNKTIQLNLGYYPYTDYEPMKFWGSNKKFNQLNKMIKCPITGNTNTKVIYEQKNVPLLQNTVYSSKEDALKARTIDVILAQSLDNGFVFSADFNESIIDYDQHYQNEQSNSSFFQEHLNGVIQILKQNGMLQKKIVE